MSGTKQMYPQFSRALQRACVFHVVRTERVLSLFYHQRSVFNTHAQTAIQIAFDHGGHVFPRPHLNGNKFVIYTNLSAPTPTHNNGQYTNVNVDGYIVLCGLESASLPLKVSYSIELFDMHSIAYSCEIMEWLRSRWTALFLVKVFWFVCVTRMINC